MRDIASEHPWHSAQGCIFTVDASLDGQKWETVFNPGRYGLRVVQFAALFPEREARFLRMHVTRLPGRVGEFGACRADLRQAEKWGWAAPECAYRTPLLAPEGVAGDQHALGVDLSLARGSIEGVVLPQSLKMAAARARAYGKLMTALQEPARPVVILTSISTSAFEPGAGLTHSGVTSQVLKDCLRVHVPADMIAEEEILAGALQGRKVLLLPDLQWLRQSVNAAIEKWAAGGGVVISETGAAVQPAGSRAVKRTDMAATAGQSSSANWSATTRW